LAGLPHHRFSHSCVFTKWYPDSSDLNDFNGQQMSNPKSQIPPRPISIGVNALYLIPGSVGGTEIYLRNLLHAFATIDPVNRYIVYTNSETGTDILPLHASNFTTKVQPVDAKSRVKRILWEQTGLLGAVRRDQIDVLLNPGYTLPFLAACPCVTVFHDMQHKVHPEYSRRRDQPFFRFFYWLAARRSSRLIAVSAATKKDMLRFYPIPPQKIRAIPHGVNPAFFSLRRPTGTAPSRMILAVSTLHPHKNLDRLVAAFAKFSRSHADYSLTIVGFEGYYADRLKALIARLGLTEKINLTRRWIPQSELYALFQSASAFIYPSTFEGFGLPVLEALAAGIPSACSDIEPLRSIVKDAALLFKPEAEDEMATVMSLLVDDQQVRERLALAGPSRAARFPWERTAKATLALLRAAARAPLPPWSHPYKSITRPGPAAY
jgi:glycosyltransferase involved in cell wall biosynthesis